ncbi:putative protein kinase CAMK-OST1L family [Rosa chinensis]|uniref:Protein kinase domain-containing protein n=1 Tax=Rosa chinensis TaxID=74649 RepID=A0A2P6QQQ0_ROSCH|nr:putative protein kinase CAMK-OST1L family [Rosa chinensis]
MNHRENNPLYIQSFTDANDALKLYHIIHCSLNVVESEVNLRIWVSLTFSYTNPLLLQQAFTFFFLVEEFILGITNAILGSVHLVLVGYGWMNNPKKFRPTQNEFLGLLYPIENYKVYGYLTNTKVKFILVTIDLDVKDADVRNIDENVQREITNHRSLRHPNIVRFKGVLVTPSNILAIVMEYAAGGELFERICSLVDLVKMRQDFCSSS